jgi:hypothetical protein
MVNSGVRADHKPTRAAHYVRCAVCGGWIDICDIAATLAHQGPLPHPVDDDPRRRT